MIPSVYCIFLHQIIVHLCILRLFDGHFSETTAMGYGAKNLPWPLQETPPWFQLTVRLREFCNLEYSGIFSTSKHLFQSDQNQAVHLRMLLTWDDFICFDKGENGSSQVKKHFNGQQKLMFLIMKQTICKQKIRIQKK